MAVAAESRKRIDESLRERRLAAYARLWQQMVIVPKWPRSLDLTYERLADFCESCRDWYFADGGMIMSEQASVAYRQLQTALGGLIDEGKKGPVDSRGEDYKRIQTLCSRLRTELTRDLFSRSRALVLWARA